MLLILICIAYFGFALASYERLFDEHLLGRKDKSQQMCAAISQYVDRRHGGRGIWSSKHAIRRAGYSFLICFRAGIGLLIVSTGSPMLSFVCLFCCGRLMGLGDVDSLKAVVFARIAACQTNPRFT